VGRALFRGAVVLVAISAVMLLFERRLIYFPQRVHDVSPGDLRLSFEDLTLTAEDGVRIHAWYLPPPGEARWVVLLAHGNGGNISHRLDRTLLLQSKLGAAVLLFDYRGYGRSEGSPDEEGTYRDARAAHRWLVEDERVSADRLVVFGESLGSAVALDLAVSRPCRALVLESPFSSVPAMARAVYPFLPLWPFVRTRYDNLSKAPLLRVPLLVLHGDRDEVVPIAQGRRVFEAAPPPKRFFAIPGAGHNDTYVVGGEAYWDAVRGFLESLPPPGAAGKAEPVAFSNVP
jgi:pimeloyl-ACP methyl ester carboxylesterase